MQCDEGLERADEVCLGDEDREFEEHALSEIEEKASASQLYCLILEQDYCCAACHTELYPEETHLDHIVPRQNGGGDTIDNLQWLCSRCNVAKGKMMMDEFIAMCEAVAKIHQPTENKSLVTA